MNLDRLVKRYLLAPAHTAWIYAGAGIAPALHRELEELLPALRTPAGRRPGFRPRRDGAIITTIEYRSLVELVLRLTTAQEVSLQIAASSVPGPDSLDRLFAMVRWELFFRPGDRVGVRVDSRASTVYHEGLIRERAEAALQKAGLTAEAASAEGAAGRITVRIERDRGRIELALAGAPLWQRGYRARLVAVAPLREDLAQAAIRAAEPELYRAIAPPRPRPPEAGAPLPEALLVPFCGTGTFLFEYAIARLGIAPGLLGREYGFSRLACGAPPSAAWLLRTLAAELAERILLAPRIEALLIDTSEESIGLARENFDRFTTLVGAGSLPITPSWITADALALPWIARVPRDAARVFLPLNPPYGRRIPTGATDELYERIGRRCEELNHDLARRGPGASCRLSGFILCPSEESWSAFSRAAASLEKETTHFTQGGIDVRLCTFAAPTAAREGR